ncbi:MAG TPA: alkaline phosphatase family protein [Baekduia sp.]|uniref:alkaline phosphatase family protein n=1 Tax=Baekduia sp. TaxID=2600305 RepID=UPI002B8C9EDA|nr:alkaline phosphatase family protein [Baekduia sp.]HMJ33664.1 alkaline phosphatase family protein [Baekduia sp.]
MAPERGTLAPIKHIVVLMMENRSFDQMLGYLNLDPWKLEGVNGLVEGMSNPDAEGVAVPIHPFGAGETAFTVAGKPYDHSYDPDHGPDGVALQLADGNQGFVTQFIASRSDEAFARRDLVMGYYTADHLPVYDHLARHFCVCDAWHSSVPGDTWPNRQYALAGQESERVAEAFGRAHGLENSKLWDRLQGAPIFDVPAFTRRLRDEQWRWYSHDPGTLRAADGRYRDPTKLYRDNFTYFDRKRVSFATELLESIITTRDSFLDDAAKGELRQVSWIDPNFIDLHVLDPNSNDDHPPSDVKAGQALVLDVYEALVNSRDWNDTLLVLVYDEHGGFFDHQVPPPVDDGDGGKYSTYGVRVPAIVVGPRVKRHVNHRLFDHATLVKTILTAFADDPNAALAAMPQRVQRANDLGEVLQETVRTDLPDRGDLHDAMDRWRAEARRARQSAAPAAVSEASDGAGQDFVPHAFQEEFATFVAALREAKAAPPGQP